jgi:hypothetical protein
MAKVERIVKTSIGDISISVSKTEVVICAKDKCVSLTPNQALSLFRTTKHFILIMAAIGLNEREQIPEEEAASELEEVERGEREMEEVI